MKNQELNVNSTEVPGVILSLLEKRKLDVGQLSSFIDPKLKTLADPYSIIDMSKAVERFYHAYINEETVGLYGDFDLDGTSGLVILKEGLSQLGFKGLHISQPHRINDGYGVHSSLLAKLKNMGCSLVLTVDVGITAHEPAKYAKEIGIDLVITDHHQQVGEIPEAIAVVNPNRNDCTSDLKYLCGAGVAFYFIRALARKLTHSGHISSDQVDLKKLLDVFCIATLTDMVPLIKDNRTLLKHGLQHFKNTERLGLCALMKKLNIQTQDISTQDIAIRLAPKLNALSRMSSEITPYMILSETNPQIAQSLVLESLKANDLRIEMQNDAFFEVEQIESINDKNFIFVVSDKFHQGVIGLIATKLCEKYQKPVLIATLKESGICVGSARGVDGFNLVDLLKSAEGHLIRFGGHEQAAGFEFEISKQNEITALFQKYFDELSKKDNNTAYQVQKTYWEYDLDLTLNEVDDDLVEWLEKIGPYGVDHPTPLFKFKNIRPESFQVLKEKHFKWKLNSKIEAMLFSTNKNKEDFGLNNIDFVCEVQKNYFAGKRTIQLLIKDVIPTQS